MENMNALQLFTNKDFGKPRAVMIEGKAWFFGEDAVRALEYNLEGKHVYSEYVKKYCEEEDYVLVDKNSPIELKAIVNYKDLGQRGGLIINEKGLVSLVEKCKTISKEKKESFLRSIGIDRKSHIVLFTRKEVEFLDTLEEQLKIFNLTQFERQYSNLKCGNYRIDLYIPELNVAIEYDENGHQGYSYEAHELRQQLIEKGLGCHFIRVNDDKSHIENSAIVLRELMKLNLLK